MKIRRLWICGVLYVLLAVAPAFAAEWYQSYEKGYKAAEKGKCAEAIPLLKESIGKQPTPNLKARPYGVISWEYIPHFYLAKCSIDANDFAGAKTYLDQAMQVDMYSSAKSADFRKMQKTVETNLGGSKPPVTTTPTKSSSK